MKLKHYLKPIWAFGQIDKYNSITVEFECIDRIVKVKKWLQLQWRTGKGEQTVFVN